jgi:hypothetical protein
MDSWNVYSQNATSTPSSTWLCSQNNTPGSEWLHPQNNINERERNENTAALATPTRYIMEYNDVNQNSSSGSYYNPYVQEMDGLFENNFLKLGNPEDLLNNNNIYNSENWMNTNETIIPVTTTTSSNIITDPISTSNMTTNSHSPTPSLITDDDQDQLYNINNNLKQGQQRIQDPVTTSTSFIQYPNTTSPTKSSSTSPISPRVVKVPITTSSSTFYQQALSPLQQRLDQNQCLQAKKHDPKQLLLPMTTDTASMDGMMTVAISSPTSNLATDDEIDQCDQTKTRSRRQSYYQDFQLSISTNDLPMQQPSPASSEFSSSVKTPPPCNDTTPCNDATPKQKKRRVSQRKNNRRTSRVHEGSLISPIDEPHLDRNGQASTAPVSESGESSHTASTNSNTPELSAKRDAPDDEHDDGHDDGHDETPEEKRARLLERNRIAAAKCRQKKKQAQESLQQQASDLTQKNTTMHTLVNDLREEALKLKNQLLAHSTCNCNVIQEYVRTSGQFAFARPPFTK